ncbi:MAG: aldo/keto reductase [Chloroflexi bacterium]|nr:aldo/keto reductase [Chloroflexota bacterium]
MEQVEFGKTGLKVSKLGIGLSEIGFNLTMDDTELAANVINSALDAGINFLDTAACYNISEEMLGATVASRRDEFVLATKAGHHVPRGEGEDWTYDLIMSSIERSLQRMKTDHLDIVQLHSCVVEVLEKGDVIRALQDARDAGKTRFIGYSGDNENAEWAVESGLFDTLQTSFSLVDQGARHKILPGAEKQGMGVIIKRPIGNAVWGAAQDPKPYNHIPEYTAAYYGRAQEMLQDGALPSEPDDRILLAMGFTYAHPEVDVCIVGTQRPAHMVSNIDLIDNKLPIAAETVEELHARYDRVSSDWKQLG